MPRRRDQIESLLEAADRIEERIADWQASATPPDAAEIRAGSRAYMSWYTRAQRFVPDDDREMFTGMYEGGAFVPRIRGFLSDPVEANFLFDEETPNPLISKYQRPFKSASKRTSTGSGRPS